MGPAQGFAVPPRPVTEAARLKALRALDLIGCTRDEGFDRITKLAAMIFSAPVALITMVDKDRQWFTSRVGCEMEQIPRDHGFCSYTILQDSVMVVPDATKDARFAANPHVTGGEQVRFYVGAPLLSANGHALGALCVLDVKARDTFTAEDQEILSGLARLVSEQIETRRSTRKLDKTAKDVQKRHTLAAMTAMDGVWEWNLTSGMVYFSARCQQVIGLPAMELIEPASYWVDRMHPDDLRQAQTQFRQHLRNKELTFHGEHRIRHSDGSWRWIKVQAVMHWGALGRCSSVTGTMVDVTQIKAFDALTGLPNRSFCLDVLETLVRNQADGLAVLMVKADRLSKINVRYGTETGDSILLTLAQRLKAAVASVKSGPRSMVGRFEGNKFLVVLEGVDEAGTARYIAQHIQDTVGMSIECNGESLIPQLSLGISVSGSRCRTAGELIQGADLAARQGKMGGSRFTVFHPQMLIDHQQRSRLEDDLQHVIERQELRVVYQPQIELKTGRLIGCEALVRWQHPSLGLLAPGAFISLAEEIGMISSIDLWVLQTACEQMAEWRGQFQEAMGLRVSVNLSSHKFAESHLNQTIRTVMDRAGLPASALCLEITETVLMRDVEAAVPILAALRKIGVGLHLDDFGAGYSSFAQLYDLPFDTLKIDRSFLRNVLTDERAKTIVEAILMLAQRLEITVIAEAVEEEAQGRLLRELGCEQAQGYLYSRPIEALAFEEKFLNGVSVMAVKSKRKGV